MLSHAPIAPQATYAPWLDDPQFRHAVELAQSHTLVDLYRLHELWMLTSQVARLPGDLIEVGTWRGGSGCLMAKRVQLLDSGATVFLCDTFTGTVKAGTNDPGYSDGEHADASAADVLALAADLGLDNIEILSGIFPDETGARLADRRFSLCHIDVDIYQSARDVVEWVWPRLAVGGIVVFDDYGFERCAGITQLVNERIGLSGGVTLHNLNGHAVVVKTGG